MSSDTSVSRRRFMRTAAVAVSAPVVAASASAKDPISRSDVLAAATVVRASESGTHPGALKLGVRVSILADGLRRENVVVSMDGVQFNASADTTRNMISTAVRDRVVQDLAAGGTNISADRVAVQVFGGVL